MKHLHVLPTKHQAQHITARAQHDIIVTANKAIKVDGEVILCKASQVSEIFKRLKKAMAVTNADRLWNLRVLSA